MRKSWRLYYDIIFDENPTGDTESPLQTADDQPDPVEIFRNRELSVDRLFHESLELDRWIDLYCSNDHERFRYAHLFHNLGQYCGHPLPEERRIYHGNISHVENHDRLRVWLESPQRDLDVHFEIPHHYDDQLQRCGAFEWQDLLERMRSPNATLFAVGTFHQKNWNTQRYLASSPSLIRVR